MGFMRIATTFAEVDMVCDYIPFISTVSNIVDLFQKCVYKCLPDNIAKNRYWSHINLKDISRCLILLVPILGNIYIAFSDYSDYQRDKTSRNRAVQLLSSFIADSLASVATNMLGKQVTREQMTPAPTVDQQQLWLACTRNDAQPIRSLLQRGISPNFYHTGQTPLVTACLHSTTEVVQLLIDAGAEVNTPDRMGISPFSAACAKGNFEAVQLIRSRITDIDAVGPKGTTPLMLAAGGGHRDIVEFLLREGADPHKKDANDRDAATYAMLSKDHVDLLSLLYPEHENIDERRYEFRTSTSSLFLPHTRQNLTPLLYATLAGANNSAIYLVRRSNVQHVDSTNSNALFYASKHMPLLEALLSKCNKAEFLNHQNVVGSTALLHALEFDRADAALFLLKSGADPFISNKLGITPLLLACEKDFVNVVQYIQQNYADSITPEIEEKVAAATQAAIARRNQASQNQLERQNERSPIIGLIDTALESLKSLADQKARDEQEIEELGPEPRSGMEMIFGKLPCAV